MIKSQTLKVFLGHSEKLRKTKFCFKCNALQSDLFSIKELNISKAKFPNGSEMLQNHPLSKEQSFLDVPHFSGKSISPENKIIQIDYPLETFHRSNQDTSLLHKPAVFEGQWVESGDLLADCSTSLGADLSLGQNLLIGYMPWEGYNFEDAILISERLVYDDLYTSVHIEKYEIEIRETELGIEQLTREIPEIEEEELEHLNSDGIAKLGSWVEQGDILIGKVTPIKKKEESPYQKLLYTILDKKFIPVRDSSLRAPKGTKAKVIDLQYNGFSVFGFNKSIKTNTPKKNTKTSFQNTVELNKKNSKTITASKPNKSSKPLEGLKGFRSTVDTSRLEFLKFESQKSQPFFNNEGLQFKASFTKPSFQSYSKNDNLKLINQLNNTQLLQEFQNSKSLSPLRKKKIKNNLFRIYDLFGSKQKQEFTKERKLYWRNVISFVKYKNSQKFKSTDVKLIDFHNSFKRKGTKSFPCPIKILYRKNILRPIKEGSNNRSALNKLRLSRKINSFNSSTNFPSGYNLGLNYKVKGLSNLMSKNPHKNRIFFLKNKSQKSIPHLASIRSIQIYLADKRKVQIGDKMSGRHGNKGIVSQILPREDMPYLPDGTPLDMVLNPLGVPSRMNVGQIYECLLGFAGKYLGEKLRVLPFDEIYGPEASRSFVYSKLYEARVKTGLNWLYDPNYPGKMRLYDGRTGDCFDQNITVGQSYILRLVHMVDDKIHARSTGPYSLVTQQPLRGRSKQGGQRLGEMEVWALEGYGAAFTLLEMLTIKSDDMTGRMTLWSNLLLDKDLSIGTPESFKVLICELQALCLDIGLFRPNPLKNYRLEKIENLMNLR